MTKNNKQGNVIAKAPKDKNFPELKNLSYHEMYNLVEKFLKKAIPIKGAKLSIVQGLKNRVATPKPPYVILQIVDNKAISTPETRYTDHYKILFVRSEITLHMTFFGSEKIEASEMATAFTVRFNDSWATEQFEKLSDCFFPLYSDDLKVESLPPNAEDQYDDVCSVTSYFEYHGELGVCEDSAKEVIMNFDTLNNENN